MEFGILEILAYLAAIFLLLYYYFTSPLNYWKARGVNGPKPLPVFGNTKNVILGKNTLGDYLRDVYEEYGGEAMIGIFDQWTPILVVKDPDMIKDVLIKDFPKFAERTRVLNTQVEPLSQHLFRQSAERWRLLRTNLTPIFSSGKLKGMFHLLMECADHFERRLDAMVAKGQPIDCREFTAKFTTDVIGSCAFGIEMKALEDENSEFRKMGRTIFTATWRSFLKDRVREMPLLHKLFGRLVIDDSVANFFTELARTTIDHRIENNIQRHDFVDVLVDLRQHPEKLDLSQVDDALLAAQSYAFFAAGFETSSITMSNALYELSMNHDIQDKLRDEIKSVLKQTGGKIEYGSIDQMKYLNAVLQETMRKYPPVMYLTRTALADYKFGRFGEAGLSIPKGQKVVIPVYAIHHDENIYPNPEIFDPARFSEDGMKTRHPMHFLPFGDGPRKCIGAKFAQNQTKVGIIKILLNHRVDVCSKTPREYKIDPKQLFLMQPAHEMPVKITRISENASSQLPQKCPA